MERYAREMVARLPALRPGAYRPVRPPPQLAHRAGHAWEQLALPLQARRAELIYCPANLAPALSRRSAVVIHDLAALRHPEAYSPAYVAYQRRMLPAIARRARLVLTVSEFSRRELCELLGLRPAAVALAPGGVDERFHPGAASTAVLRRLGLHRPYVLAVATASGRKNLGVLEPVAQALAADGVDLVLAGSDRGYLRGGQSRLRRLGYVPEPDLPALYAGARALVLPSRHEGFGLPCLEAMASGVPVVAADAAALPDTCGDAATLVAADDPAAFLEALRQLEREPDLRAERVRSGRRRAAQFPWSLTAERTDAALQAALAGAAEAPL